MSRPLKGKKKRISKSFTLSQEAADFLERHYKNGTASEYIDTLIMTHAKYGPWARKQLKNPGGSNA